MHPTPTLKDCSQKWHGYIRRQDRSLTTYVRNVLKDHIELFQSFEKHFHQFMKSSPAESISVFFDNRKEEIRFHQNIQPNWSHN